ncbi:MAG: hypothetical protein R8K22_01380, partial [Mariprofundaceae bacterium]
LESKKGKKVFDEEKKAVKELQKILDEDDSIDATLIQMAIDDLCKADKTLAQTAIDDVNDPDNKKIIEANKKMDKAQSELDKDKCDKAIEKYKEALVLIPEPITDWEVSTWVYVAIGDARFKEMNYEKALMSFSNAICCPSGTGNPFIHLRLGQCEFELGDLIQALDELLRAYMGGGKDIFYEDDPKYYNFLKSHKSIVAGSID